MEIDRSRLRLTLGALAVVVLLSSLDQTVVSTALPTIMRQLGHPERIAWIVTAYLLTATATLPIYGKLGDLFGRRMPLIGATIIFLIGSVGSGLADSLAALIFFRATQGMGGGGLAVTALASVGELAPEGERARYQGLFSALFGVSAVAGPLLGGFITDTFSWRWIFLLNLPLGAVALACIFVLVPRSKPKADVKIDVAGAFLLGAFLCAIVLVASLGGAIVRWISPIMIVLATVAAGLLLATISAERRASDPVVPLALLGTRKFRSVILASFLTGLPLFGAVTFTPLFWQTVRGFGPTAAGLATLSLVACSLISSAGTGWAASRLGRERPFAIVGAGLAFIGLLGTATLSGNGLVYITTAVSGVGLGMSTTILLVIAQSAARRGHIGVATSAVTMVRALGGLVAVAFLGAVYARQLRDSGPAQALRAVFLASASGAALQFLTSLRLPRDHNSVCAD